MRLLDLAYMQARYPGQIGAASGPSYVSAGVRSSGISGVRVAQAVDEAESWFVRQIPVFAQADPDLLPADLKAAIADIAYDRLFDTQSKDKSTDTPKAQQARELILRLAPGYDGAKLDQGKIVLDAQAGLVAIAGDWR